MCGMRFKLSVRFSIKDNKGSALVLALVLVSFLTVVCCIVLNGSLLQLKFIRRLVYQRQALYLAEAGVAKTLWYLSGNEDRGFRWHPKNEEIELFDGYTAIVSVEPWGGYLSVISRAEYRGMFRSVRALVGEVPPSSFQNAITIGGTEYPLVVTGKNRIIGDVVVGSKGVQEGWIRGRGLETSDPVVGNIFTKKETEMPYFNAAFFRSAFRKYQNLLRNPGNAEILYKDIYLDNDVLESANGNNIHVDGDVIVSDVNVTNHGKESWVLSCSGDMTIRGGSRIGPYIELVADGRIVVTDSVCIRRGVLYAGKGMEISGKAQIEGQLFSPVGIRLSDDAALEYPSVIYCTGYDENNMMKGEIVLQDRAKVKGAMILCPEDADRQDMRDETMGYIGPDAKLVGSLYAQHSTELRGTVYGSVATGEFYLYVSPTTYINWLQDAYVDRSKLPDVFLMPLLFDDNPDLSILVWDENKEKNDTSTVEVAKLE